MGSYLAEHTRLVGIDRDGFTIAVPSSGWAQELVYWKPEILRRLNELAPGAEVPRVIRIRVAPKIFEKAADAGDSRAERGRLGMRAQGGSSDLAELARSVMDKHASAVEQWLSGDYTRCARCQSPTLKGYRLCATCQYRQSP